jgi:uncharacterized repeat protein (TIGR03803 family)
MFCSRKEPTKISLRATGDSKRETKMRKAALFLVALLAVSAFLIPLIQAQTLTVLYSFSAGADGANPHAPLILDKAGNLYGTTYQGGSYGFGTLFKLDTTGKKTVLYSFKDTPDGAFPTAGLIMDKAGNLYGTTEFGGGPIIGAISGTVFKLDTAGNETVLYSFKDTPDGQFPTQV